jgi:putative transposase
MDVDRGSYRYEPRPDLNGPLREALIAPAQQKPRYGYRRLHVLLEKREHRSSVMRIYRPYRAEGLAVR